ncbi:MAG: phosphotransferase [Deinococcus sp.]|nr:phosphotransferase [Deinococcus sp.]
MPSIPEAVEAYTGKVLGLEEPFQGEESKTWVLVAEKGRFVLKTNKHSGGRGLENELRVLSCLPQETPEVPRAVALFEHQGVGYGLQTFLRGENLVHAFNRADVEGKHRLARSFGQALARIHAWQPAIPRPADTLELLLERIEAGLREGALPEFVEHDGWFGGWSSKKLLAEVRSGLRFAGTRLAFTHGDYCVPNALVQQGKVAAVVDWPHAGYADPRLDLAAGAWSLEYNLKSRAFLPSFFEGYGYQEAQEEIRFFEGLWVLR